MKSPDALQQYPRSNESAAVRPLLVSVEQATRLLGIGRSSLYPLLQTGEVPSVKLAGRRLIALAELERFVAGLAEAEDGF